MGISIPASEGPRQLGTLTGSSCSSQLVSFRNIEGIFFFFFFKAQFSFLEGAKEAGRESLYEVICQFVMVMIYFQAWDTWKTPSLHPCWAGGLGLLRPRSVELGHTHQSSSRGHPLAKPGAHQTVVILEASPQMENAVSSGLGLITQGSVSVIFLQKMLKA